jgi:hypothetical protein
VTNIKLSIGDSDQESSTVVPKRASPVIEFNRVGLWDGPCAESECRETGARWWHIREHKHYCDACATMINLNHAINDDDASVKPCFLSPDNKFDGLARSYSRSTV